MAGSKQMWFSNSMVIVWSMKSMAGMTTTRFGIAQEKNNVASLRT